MPEANSTEFKPLDLSGQTAVVTGAATGIGEAIARRLALAGAAIAVVDLNMAGGQQVAGALGGSSFAVQADVARAADVERAVDGDVHEL